MFTVELLQAISDWQRGGDAKQKKNRGEALKKVAQELPNKYKSISVDCYRQIALEKESVWNIGTKYQLSETISSWTTSLDIAKTFKGGVPPIGYQGVIFKINPTDNLEVIINLPELFKCDEFKKYLDLNKGKVNGYDKGIGLYENTQQEIVIYTEYLNLNSLFAWGGYSSPEMQLAKIWFGHHPSSEELEQFRDLMKREGCECGAHWLTTPDAVARVSEKLKFHGGRLSKINGQQQNA